MTVAARDRLMMPAIRLRLIDRLKTAPAWDDPDNPGTMLNLEDVIPDWQKMLRYLPEAVPSVTIAPAPNNGMGMEGGDSPGYGARKCVHNWILQIISRDGDHLEAEEFCWRVLDAADRAFLNFPGMVTVAGQKALAGCQLDGASEGDFYKFPSGIHYVLEARFHTIHFT